MTEVGSLTPRQEEILTDLLRFGQPRPAYDREMGRRLREDTRRALEPLAEDLPSDCKDIAVTKYVLGQVHSCEAHFLAPDSFEWNIRNAFGRVMHRAIETMIVFRYSKSPIDAAEAAIARLSSDEGDPGSLSHFLQTMSVDDRQDLIRDANDALLKFCADWPPVSTKWKPRIESSVRVSLKRVTLQGRYDLALGQPEGNEARVFIVDFKTGSERSEHKQDVRFYALLETLRSYIPPYRVATYYLESGSYQFDDVSEELLQSQLRRVIEGVQKMVDLKRGKAPTYTPGPACYWCSLRRDCDTGKVWLQERME